MWCLLSLVYFCLSRCCRRNETGVPNPGFPGGSFPGLCGVSSSGDCAHRADHGQRPAHLLLSCAFGMDGFPAVFHQFHCLGHLSDPAESIRRRNRVSLCRSWRCLLHRGFSHRPTVGAPGVGDLVDVGCAPHLNPCAVADLFELPHAAAIFGALDVPLVYFSIWIFRTQHPQPVIGGGGSIDPRMMHVLLINWFAFLWLAALLCWSRYRLEYMRRELEETQVLEALLEPRSSL